MTSPFFLLDNNTFNLILNLLPKSAKQNLFLTSKLTQASFFPAFCKHLIFSRVYNWTRDQFHLVQHVSIKDTSENSTNPVLKKPKLEEKEKNIGEEITSFSILQLEDLKTLILLPEKENEKNCTILENCSIIFSAFDKLRFLSTPSKYLGLSLPPSLVELHCSGYVYHKCVKLPRTLAKLKITCDPQIEDDFLPPDLEELHITFRGEEMIDPRTPGELTLPEKLRKLSIYGEFDRQVIPPRFLRTLISDIKCPELRVPYFLDEITIFESIQTYLGYYNCGVVAVNNKAFDIFKIKSSIRKCRLGDAFQGFITFSSESKLTHLSLGNSFNGSLDRLPEGLIELELGDKYYHDISSLPKSLKKLYISANYNHIPPNFGDYEVVFKYDDKRRLFF